MMGRSDGEGAGAEGSGVERVKMGWFVLSERSVCACDVLVTRVRAGCCCE